MKCDMKTFEREINESNPCVVKTTLSYNAYELAMQLVGERYKKWELVNLVRWLIMDKGETANAEISRIWKETPQLDVAATEQPEDDVYGVPEFRITNPDDGDVDGVDRL